MRLILILKYVQTGAECECAKSFEDLIWLNGVIYHQNSLNEAIEMAPIGRVHLYTKCTYLFICLFLFFVLKETLKNHGTIIWFEEHWMNKYQSLSVLWKTICISQIIANFKFRLYEMWLNPNNEHWGMTNNLNLFETRKHFDLMSQ